jgi:hypothetical protein
MLYMNGRWSLGDQPKMECIGVLTFIHVTTNSLYDCGAENGGGCHRGWKLRCAPDHGVVCPLRDPAMTAPVSVSQIRIVLSLGSASGYS